MSLSFTDLRIGLTVIFVVLMLAWVIHYIWKKSFLDKKLFLIKNILKGFKAKMWMTCGLGITFFGFYLFVVVLSSTILNGKWISSLFWQAYQTPLPFIYGGLLLFACFSLLIYLVRMVIKYLFLTRGKGD